MDILASLQLAVALNGLYNFMLGIRLWHPHERGHVIIDGNISAILLMAFGSGPLIWFMARLLNPGSLLISRIPDNPIVAMIMFGCSYVTGWIIFSLPKKTGRFGHVLFIITLPVSLLVVKYGGAML